MDSKTKKPKKPVTIPVNKKRLLRLVDDVKDGKFNKNTINKVFKRCSKDDVSQCLTHYFPKDSWTKILDIFDEIRAVLNVPKECSVDNSVVEGPARGPEAMELCEEDTSTVDKFQKGFYDILNILKNLGLSENSTIIELFKNNQHLLKNENQTLFLKKEWPSKVMAETRPRPRAEEDQVVIRGADEKEKLRDPVVLHKKVIKLYPEASNAKLLPKGDIIISFKKNNKNDKKFFFRLIQNLCLGIILL